MIAAGFVLVYTSCACTPGLSDPGSSGEGGCTGGVGSWARHTQPGSARLLLDFQVPALVAHGTWPPCGCVQGQMAPCPYKRMGCCLCSCRLPIPQILATARSAPPSGQRRVLNATLSASADVALKSALDSQADHRHIDRFSL